MPTFSDPDFDRYCREHDIGPGEYAEAFASWLSEQMEKPVRFEKVAPGRGEHPSARL